MMARVPTTHIPLSEAVIEAALAWHSEEIGGAGLTSDEFTMLARHWFALTRVRQSERRTKDARNGIRRPGARVYVTQQDRDQAGVTNTIAQLSERGQSLTHVPAVAWDRLREMLLAGRLRGRLFSDDHGQVDIPTRAWRSSDADPAHELGAVRFGLGQTVVEGPAGIGAAELDSVLTGSSGPSAEESPGTSTRSATSDEPTPATPDQGGPKTARPRKATPAFDRARQAMSALYPEGVPNQTNLTNKELEAAVSRYIESEYPKQVKVSKDTIIRAAGRRK